MIWQQPDWGWKYQKEQGLDQSSVVRNIMTTKKIKNQTTGLSCILSPREAAGLRHVYPLPISLKYWIVYVKDDKSLK